MATPKKAVAKKAASRKPARKKKPGRSIVKKKFTIVTHIDPRRREGEVYLDDVQREKAEIQRAKVEGRKPNLDNPGSTAGDVVRPTAFAAKDYPGDVKVEPDVELEVAVKDD